MIKFSVASENETLTNSNCLLVALLTHGGENGRVYASDKAFHVNELWENFIEDKCPELIGKPKLFFVQACKGSMVDPGVYYKKIDDPLTAAKSKGLTDEEMAKNYVIPSLADLLIMYSTADGFCSFRDEKDGSWFIQVI